MGNIDFIDCPYRVKCNKASAKWQSREELEDEEEDDDFTASPAA